MRFEADMSQTRTTPVERPGNPPPVALVGHTDARRRGTHCGRAGHRRLISAGKPRRAVRP
jgi:hypothetical protein